MCVWVHCVCVWVSVCDFDLCLSYYTLYTPTMTHSIPSNVQNDCVFESHIIWWDYVSTDGQIGIRARNRAILWFTEQMTCSFHALTLFPSPTRWPPRSPSIQRGESLHWNRQSDSMYTACIRVKHSQILLSVVLYVQHIGMNGILYVVCSYKILCHAYDIAWYRMIQCNYFKLVVMDGEVFMMSSFSHFALP